MRPTCLATGNIHQCGTALYICNNSCAKSVLSRENSSISVRNAFCSKLHICCNKKIRNIKISRRVGVKYSTCTWYLHLSTYLSVLDVLEYLVYGNAKVLVLDQKVLGTYKLFSSTIY